MTRPATLSMLKSLKLATRSAIHAAGPGGAAALVEQKLVRVGEFALSVASSMSEQNADRFAALDVALDLDFIAGEPLHARAIAAAQGYRLEPIVEVASDEPLCVRAVAQFGKETSALKLCVLDALADDVLDDKDRLAIEARISDVERELADMRAKLRGAA